MQVLGLLPDGFTLPSFFQHNPNTVTSQNFVITIPKSPVKAENEGCMPMGAIGMAINGVAFYNPYTAQRTDAVENEVS